MKRVISLYFLFFILIQFSFSQQSQDSITNLFDNLKVGELPYRLLKPLNFDTKKKYPVILSLHGAGGRGTDNVKQIADSKWLKYLAGEEIRSTYSCYIVGPQSMGLWSEEQLALLKTIIKELPSVDLNRIYILGHSMGGHGSYRFIQFDPTFFAAAAPSAGSGLPETEDFIDVNKIKNIPVWAFHGDKDPKCPYEKDVKVFEEMTKVCGNMKFTTWHGDAHGGPVALKMLTGANNGTTQMSSNQCDAEPVFLKWLFKQRR
ncbi:MAG: dienelactone hydrolase family protein [Paludibacter sp.]